MVFSNNRLIKSITKILSNNLPKIQKEIQETKELSHLLYKWGRTGHVSKAEKKIIKAQLLDILKAIPALAILIIPFGTLVLYLLIKMLPFNILPSAFIENEDHEIND